MAGAALAARFEPATLAAGTVRSASCSSWARARASANERRPLSIVVLGGSVTAGLALYDTMGHVSSDVITVNAGAAG